ncbi:MAG: glyoxalase family protein [Verrucomicrobia bacterium]|nr:glyoxalase family protein [Verrucomicrobiota bacterium]
MHSNPATRLAALLVAIASLGLEVSAAEPGTFQPLNQTATQDHFAGKFIWADLFTTDPAAATRFYCGVFGWTSVTLDQKGKAYTVFSNQGHPVAGLAPRPRAKSGQASRWIGYISVSDIAATLAQVKSAGGKVRAPARAFPDRGIQAIIADNEESTVGLLQSTSGDPPDDEPDPGEWNWFELYARQPESTAGFYHQVFGYTAALDTRTERKGDFLLSTGEDPRAGVAPLPERDDAQPGWLGVIRVSDLDAKLAKVKALGGEVLVPPRATAYGSRFAIIADPTGGTVGLVEYADNANPATRP